jgi:cytochrome c oxidase subunit 2
MKLPYLPPLASQHGQKVDDLTLYVHLLMIALFIGWFLYFLYAIWRFRKGRNPKADYVGTTTHASSVVEVAVALVEGALLFGLAIPMWATSVEKFPDPKTSTVIRITGRQFNWIVRYPGADGIFGKQDISLVSSENPMGIIAKDPKLKNTDTNGLDDVILETSEIAVPVNKPVIAHITSLDVIHSFKVVSMRVTQDANPGMSIPIHFIPTVIGTNQIQCSQLCGNSHYTMRGLFKVMSQPDYDAWLLSKPKIGSATPAASFE